MELRIPKDLPLIYLSIGTDILSNKRIEKNINNEKFIYRILSPQEAQIFEKIKNHSRKVEFLSGRFCAKESITKALKYKPNFNQITILSSDVKIDQNLESKIKKKLNLKEFKLKVSISHEKEFTISFCLAVLIK